MEIPWSFLVFFFILLTPCRTKNYSIAIDFLFLLLKLSGILLRYYLLITTIEQVRRWTKLINQFRLRLDIKPNWIGKWGNRGVFCLRVIWYKDMSISFLSRGVLNQGYCVAVIFFFFLGVFCRFITFICFFDSFTVCIT